jgi:hypothetical protein
MRHFTWCSTLQTRPLSKNVVPRSAAFAVLPLALAACVATLTPAVVVNPLDSGVDYSQLASMKQGKSCAVTYLFTFGPNGDASIAAAAKEGGLRRVRYVDNRYENSFWRQRYCIITYGE